MPVIDPPLPPGILACPTARTGYATRERAEAALAEVKKSKSAPRKWPGEVQPCVRCGGFHVVQPKKAELLRRQSSTEESEAHMGNTASEPGPEAATPVVPEEEVIEPANEPPADPPPTTDEDDKDKDPTVEPAAAE